jgi:hypothetical protein
MRVDLLKCVRCSLRWVDDEGLNQCPRCKRWSAKPTVVTLAGQNVEVSAIRLFGESAMRDPRGLEVLNLGTRCGHGFIHPSLCQECSFSH